ncbi:hypothetical protein JTE90_027907 [Oedothorax gibbosus]|uniref:Uncharacterized protein n=1 Tax=Oedothorax gibbosus TaxID=931172 RepID=A0AAV6UBW0_9ARAC|nr:hypothetical protein JTE90_027907 [Oedothorax gibbosus]
MLGDGRGAAFRRQVPRQPPASGAAPPVLQVHRATVRQHPRTRGGAATPPGERRGSAAHADHRDGQVRGRLLVTPQVPPQTFHFVQIPSSSMRIYFHWIGSNATLRQPSFGVGTTRIDSHH